MELLASVSYHSPMITITKGALDGTLPTQTLRVTGSHAIFYRDVWVRAIDLQHLDGISIAPANQEMVYNILLKHHSTIIVGGLTVETMDPRDMRIVSAEKVTAEKVAINQISSLS